MDNPAIKQQVSVKDEDEEEAWARFDPMKDEFENTAENSYMMDSVGGTLPRNLYYGKNNAGQSREVKLYVSKIPKHITEGGLRNIFAKHGNVLYVHLVSKKDQSYRYGFVSLSNIIEADRAIQGLNHKPPFNLHIEFEMSEQEKNERVLVENCVPVLMKMSLNHIEDPLYDQDADYTIKEKVLYSPGLPLEGLDWTQFSSCVDGLEEYHLYDLLPQCTQLYEPYLVWDTTNVDDVSHVLALRYYITVDNWIGKNVMPQESTPHRLHQITNSNSVKTFGAQESKPIQSCVYCHRKVFKSSPLLCSCGVVYDDILCQHKHWPVHRTQCMDQKSSRDCIDSTKDCIDSTKDCIDATKDSNNCQQEEDFRKITQEFKTFYSRYGTVVDHGLGSINIVPKLWWNKNSAVSLITNETLIKSYLVRSEEIVSQPDLSSDQVHLGQLVGVLLANPPLHVRGIVACITEHCLIGVLPLEIDIFVLVPTVKLLKHTTGGASNVQCTIEYKDEDYSLENNRQFTRLKKSSNKYRAFDESLNSCTVQLTPYLPSLEQLPLCCITIDNKTKVLLTAFHSSKVFYVQPLDMDTRIKFTSMASDFNLWCTNNHPNQTSDWIPKKNSLVGVRLTSGEYQRGQVIGIVTPWKAEIKSDVVEDSIPNVQTETKVPQFYLISLIDSGNNVKVGIENLVPLPSHFRKDPCFCTKISLKNSNLKLNLQCFQYLNVLIETKTPLILDLTNEESMTADLILESGDSVCDQLDNLTALPWQIAEGDNVKDPTKTDQVSTLSQLSVPLYPLQRNQRYPLRLIKIIDTCYAAMMMLSREETQYVHTELSDIMKQYCDHLTLEKYNPASGSYCLAYCRELKLWTRARCEKSSDQHGHCYIFLVDYGVHAHLPISDLRPCHSLFTQYHALAFIAYIPELETIELSESEILRKYSSHAYKVMDVVNCDAQNSQDRVVLTL